MERRDFLRRLGLTTAGVAVGVTAGAKVLATPEDSSAVQPTGELWIDKAAFDAEMDANDKAHNEWVEDTFYIRNTDGTWYLSESERDADRQFNHEFNKRLFLGT